MLIPGGSGEPPAYLLLVTSMHTQGTVWAILPIISINFLFLFIQGEKFSFLSVSWTPCEVVLIHLSLFANTLTQTPGLSFSVSIPIMSHLLASINPSCYQMHSDLLSPTLKAFYSLAVIYPVLEAPFITVPATDMAAMGFSSQLASL